MEMGIDTGLSYNVDLVLGDYAYSGSATRNLLLVLGIYNEVQSTIIAYDRRYTERHRHTTENCSVNCQEAIFQSLLEISALESVLFRDDVVQMVACVQGNFVSSMAVVDTKIGDSEIGIGWLQFFVGLERL